MHQFMTNVVVIAAHADDESFGMGGTLAKLSANGVNLHWLILSKLWSPKWHQKTIEQRKIQIDEVQEQAGFKTLTQWDYQDNCLDTIPINELQTKLITYLDRIRPDAIFSPGPWDFNHEHRLACQLVEMSIKPAYTPYLNYYWGYEIPSSTEWSLPNIHPMFQPNWYVDISEYYQQKLGLCNCYKEENHSFPHSRSSEYLEALAKKRGAEAALTKAEAFFLFRAKV